MINAGWNSRNIFLFDGNVHVQRYTGDIIVYSFGSVNAAWAPEYIACSLEPNKNQREKITNINFRSDLIRFLDIRKY